MYVKAAERTMSTDSKLFMPALTVIKNDKSSKQLNKRLYKTKANNKIAIIVVARKLLLLIYCL